MALIKLRYVCDCCFDVNRVKGCVTFVDRSHIMPDYITQYRETANSLFYGITSGKKLQLPVLPLFRNKTTDHSLSFVGLTTMNSTSA